MDRGRIWTAAIFLFLFGGAAAMQARGPILVRLEEAFDVSEAALGLVAPAGTAGFTVAIVVTGLFAGRINIRHVLLLGVVGVTCALVAMAAAPIYTVFLLALLLQGTAAGAFRGVDRVVLSHLNTGRRGQVYTVYALVWAVGAVLGPQLVSMTLAVADWRAVFLIITLCFVPVAAVAASVELPSMAAERSISLATLRSLLRRPSVTGACVGMYIVGSLEGTIFTWLAYYATGFIDATTANLLLSTYLLAYIPARLIFTLAIDHVPYLALLLVATVSVIPALAIVFSGATGLTLFAAVFIAGACLSSGFPILTAYAVEAAPEYTGPLNALTNGTMYIGMSLTPAIVGVLAELYGIQRTLWLTVVMAAALVITLVAMLIWTGTADAPTASTPAD